MATVTKENIGLLHEKLTVKLEKTDYLPSFEKALKNYSKNASQARQKCLRSMPSLYLIW